MPAKKPSSSTAPGTGTLAKLSSPRLKNPAARPRLFQLLDRTDTPVVWMSGPPGTGKTTLVASYLAQSKAAAGTRGAAPLWLQFDADDTQPSNFFHYLRLALGVLLPRAALLVPDSGDRGDWTAFTRRFARQLFGGTAVAGAWVFDNTQEIADSELVEILATLVSEAPDSLRFFFLSHHAPPPAFAELLARGRLMHLDAATLRFDAEETRALVATLSGASAADATHLPERIHQVTRGWAAGIVLLAARSLPGPAPAAPDVASLSEFPEIFAFFARQVYERLPPDTRRTLAACCWLPEFDADLAVAASGVAAAGTLLDKLHRDGFFIERRSASEASGRKHAHSYQFHQLFRVFLQQQTLEQGGPDAVQAAQLRAAGLLRGRMYWEAAIAAYLEARHWQEAAELIVERAQAFLAQGRHEQVMQWIDALLESEAALRTDPWLLYWRGVAQSYGEEDAARESLAAAYAAFDARGDRDGCVLAATAALCAMSRSWASLRDADHWFDRAVTSYAPDMTFDSADSELLVLSGLLFGQVLCGRQFELQERAMLRIAALQDAAADMSVRLMSVSAALNVAEQTAGYERVMMLVHRMNAALKTAAVAPAHLGEWLLNLAGFYSNAAYSLAQPQYNERCGECLAKVKSLALENELKALYVPIALVENQRARGDGDIAAARATFEQAETWVEFCLPRYLPMFYQKKAQLSLLTGNPRAALREIQLAIEYEEHSGAPKHALDVLLVTEATAHFRAGDVARAHEVIDAALARAPDGRARVWATVKAFYAAHHAAREDTPQAPALLSEFFAALASLQHYNAMLFAAPELAWLCARALTRDVEPAFVREMIARRKFLPPDNADRHWPWPLKIEALGRFDVLVDGKPIEFEGKAQKKPMEMLQLLVAMSDPAHVGSGVKLQQVMDELWPDEEAKDPKGSFDTTLHRLRKLLGVDSAIQVADGRLLFNRALVWCDVFVFESQARGARDRMIAEADLLPVVDLYRGPLFGALSHAWTLSARERLAVLFNGLVGKVAARMEDLGDLDSAIRLYEHALQQDNCVESFYRGLMRCHLARGETAEALRTYRRCRELLSIVLGSKPAAETEALHAQVVSAG